MTTITDWASLSTCSPPKTTWRIRVDKEYLKFSAAHFLIFEDGTAERLHGHNYRVALEVATRSERHGMVVDFKRIKPILRRILEPLDERFLVPGEHAELTCEPDGEGSVVIRYADRRYVIPAEDVVVLPVSNTSSENLAAWIACAVAEALGDELPDVPLVSLEVSVEETAGQRGAVTLDF